MNIDQKLAGRKSSRSAAGGKCVELCWIDDNSLAIRDSKNPRTGFLTIGGKSARRFLGAIKSGQLD